MLVSVAAWLLVMTARSGRVQLSSQWNGRWTESVAESSLFIASSLRIERVGSKKYLVVEPGSKGTRVVCGSVGGSCRSLSVPAPVREAVAREGVNYTLDATGSELAVETWRVVPDGSRVTDADFYARSSPGRGWSGKWRKTRSVESPTTYRISLGSDRLEIATPDGEIHISISLREAETSKGAGVSMGAGRTNTYRILGPLEVLETSRLRGQVVGHSVLALSGDGQTMTEDHTDAGKAPHPLHIVYHRSESCGPVLREPSR